MGGRKFGDRVDRQYEEFLSRMNETDDQTNTKTPMENVTGDEVDENGNDKDPHYRSKKVKDGHPFVDEPVDADFAEFLSSTGADNNQTKTKSSMENVIEIEDDDDDDDDEDDEDDDVDVDVDVDVDEEEDEDEVEEENEDEEDGEVSEDEDNESEGEDENEDDDDPQYSMFLKNITECGKSFKLKVSGEGEAPRYLEYEQQGILDEFDPVTSTDASTGKNDDSVNSSEDTSNTDDLHEERSLRGKQKNILLTKKVSGLEKQKPVVEPLPDTGTDYCYQMFLDGNIDSENPAFEYKGQVVGYESAAFHTYSQMNQVDEATSDSDILIWDEDPDRIEVNDNQTVTAEKDPALMEEILCILRQPYSDKEFEELLQYIEDKRPVNRLLPLRDRDISSAMDGLGKSVLDDAPPTFRRKFEAVRNQRPAALSLLRGFRFWLEHLPHEKVFRPWLDEECLSVQPLPRSR